MIASRCIRKQQQRNMEKKEQLDQQGTTSSSSSKSTTITLRSNKEKPRLAETTENGNYCNE